jgi:flagellar biosynthesis protein FlhG
MNVSSRSGDQADTLRLLAISRNGQLQGATAQLPKVRRGNARVISVTSGKGGVGKSSVVVNLAVALANEGKRVLVIDADLGLGNIDMLLGLNPSHTLNDVFSGKMRLADIIIEGPGGIRLVPAGSGVQRYTDLGRDERLRLMDELEMLEDDFDVLIIDTESGISKNVTYFNVASQEILLVVAPEPTSITDSYALIKLLTKFHDEGHFKVLVNMARDDSEGLQVFKKLSQVVSRFLDVSLDYVGCVLRDEHLQDAVRRQKSVVELYPRSAVSQCFATLSRTLIEHPVEFRVKGNIQFLFRRYFEPAQTKRCV